MPTFRHLFTGLYLLSLCSLWACQSETATAYQNTVHLTQQDFQHRVQSEGELVPLEKTTLQVPRRLWGTLEYLAPEGTQVKKGDVVARVSTRQFTERVSRYINSMADNQTDMRVRQMKVPLEALKSQANLAQQSHAADLKKLTETEVRQGPRENERVAARVEEEKARLQASAVPLTAQEQLEAKGYISTAEVNAARQNRLQQETLAKQAELKQIQQQMSYRQPDISKAALETRAAELQAQITELEGAAQASLLRTQELSSKSRAASLNRRVQSMESRLNNAEMTAPFSGTVIYPRISGFQAPYIGMEVYNGMPIAQVAKTDSLQVITRVHEFDIPAVKVGQKATVQAPGIAEPLTGKVSKIQKLARYKNEQKPVGLKYFDVEITLDNPRPPADFKAQMQVSVDIEAEDQPQAWVIPLEYLVDGKVSGKDQDSFFLWQAVNGSPEKVTVKVGPRNSNQVVILGDWTGDEVFMLPAEVNAP